MLLSFADLATSCPIPYVRPDLTPSVRLLFFLVLLLIFADVN